MDLGVDVALGVSLRVDQDVNMCRSAVRRVIMFDLQRLAST